MLNTDTLAIAHALAREAFSPPPPEDRTHSDTSWDSARPNTVDLYDGGNRVALRITFPTPQMRSKKKREGKMGEVLELYVREGRSFIERWVTVDGATVEDRLAKLTGLSGYTPEAALYEISTGRA